MTRIAKAKRCPFCASTDSFVECYDYGSFYVTCNSCQARGPIGEGDGMDDTSENYRGRRSAIKEWNQRRRQEDETP